MNLYTKKREFMSENELKFFKVLKELEDELDIIIHPQINLATIIKKNYNNKYVNELFRNIDFAIFNKDYKKLLILIEINDKSHEKQERKERDEKVNNILKISNIKLLKFYTTNTNKYPNKPDYIKKRIRKKLIELNY